MSSFPTSLQDLDATRGTSGQPLSNPNHITQHALEDSTIEALQAKLGINNSADATSIDYLLKNTSSIDPGHKHTAGSVTMGLDDISNVVLTSPINGNGLVFNGTNWVNADTSVVDASATVKGVAKLSVAPVSSTAPIAVGDNDPRFTTSSGTTLNGTSNKLIDQADVSSAAASGKIVRAVGTALPALDASNLTNVMPGYVAGVISDLNTTLASNNDVTITTTFTPRLIRLQYYMAGHTPSGGTNIIDTAKGLCIFNATTLASNNVEWTQAGAGALTHQTSPSNSTAPSLGNIGTPNGGIAITLAIASVSSTSFVIRRATTINGTGGTALASISYEAFA